MAPTHPAYTLPAVKPSRPTYDLHLGKGRRSTRTRARERPVGSCAASHVAPSPPSSPLLDASFSSLPSLAGARTLSRLGLSAHRPSRCSRAKSKPQSRPHVGHRQRRPFRAVLLLHPRCGGGGKGQRQASSAGGGASLDSWSHVSHRRLLPGGCHRGERLRRTRQGASEGGSGGGGVGSARGRARGRGGGGEGGAAAAAAEAEAVGDAEAAGGHRPAGTKAALQHIVPGSVPAS